MKAILFGAVLGVLLIWPPAVPLAVDLATQPAVLTFSLGVLARPAIVRRVRRWAT